MRGLSAAGNRQRLVGAQNPGAFMSDKANLWIIGDRFRRGQEHQHGPRAHLITSFLDKRGADPLALVRRGRREVGGEDGEFTRRPRDMPECAALRAYPAAGSTVRRWRRREG